MNRWVVGIGLIGLASYAQPPGAEPVSIPMKSMYIQSASVPPSTVTNLNLVVDASAGGGDFVDVMASNSQAAISLILPSSVQVTPANAAGLGFSIYQQVNPDDSSGFGFFTPFDIQGAHTVFVLPAGSTAGTYQVQVDTTGITTATDVSLTYSSLSNIHAGITLSGAFNNPGNPVVMTTAVFSGNTPISGATINATVVPPVNLNGQASVGNIQLVGSGSSGSGFTRYTYQATLTNGSGTFPLIIANLINVPSTIAVIGAGNLGFTSVPASGTSTSINTFTLQVPSSQTLDPTMLSWDINAQGTPVIVALTDGGTYDAAIGDGLYDNAYTPTALGTYQVLVDIQGTFAGAAFRRTLVTSFQVVSPTATLTGVTDIAHDDDGDGLYDRLTLNGQLNVQSAGQYQLSVDLTASNSQTISVSGTATLQGGGGQIGIDIPPSLLRSLGVDGPYEKKNAALVFVPASGDTIGAGYITDAGPTASYTLASFAQDPLFFTGQYSSTPIDSNGITGFETLNVGLSVGGVALSQQLQQSCDASGDLYAGDTLLDTATGTQAYSSGAASVTITLGFNGYRIRNAGLNGPYTLTNVTVICGNARVSGDNLFQTPVYTASQFELGSADFSLSGPASVTAVISPVVSAAILTVNIAYNAGFNQPIQFSVTGVPTGSAASMAFPVAQSLSSVNVAIATASTPASATPPGSYTLTVTGTSGSLSHSVNVAFIVQPLAALPTFSPVAGTYGSAQSVTISSATQNPVIYYTVDGSTPNFSSSFFQPGFSDPITISSTATIKAFTFTYASGFSPSGVATASYTIQPIVATPTFSPVAGTYTAGQTVTISTSTSGATIRYTTDGSTPSETAGTVYSSPITVNAAMTIKAIAYETGYTDSSVAMASYAISGWYNGSWSNRKPVTVDHTKVTGGSDLTSYPMLLSVTDTDVAAAAQSSGNDILFTAADGVTKLNHEIESYTSSSGKLVAWVQIPTLSASADTLIYMYYGNGSASNQQNATGVWDSNYKGVWHLPNGTTLTANDSTSNGLNAVSTSAGATSGNFGGGASFNGSNQYIMLPTTSIATTVTASAWVYSSNFNQNGFVVSKDNVNTQWQLFFEGALKWRGGGSDNNTTCSFPSNSAWHYVVGTQSGTTTKLYIDGVACTASTSSAIGNGSGDIEIGRYNSGYYFNGSIDEVRVSNIGRSAGWIGTEYNNESSPGTFFSEGSASYAAGTPTFSPAGGAYATTQTVTITTSTSGATIRYTTDGSTPSETAGTVYSAALTVSSTTTIKAIAYKAGYTDSSVATATYTIQPIVATPTFSPVAGTYTAAQTVTISTSTSGATIRYTTDGSTPSETAGTVYSGALTVSAATTIKAIAYETGYTDSSVATASYVISAWYIGSWSNRKAITVDHTKVAGGSDLTSYPLLFSVTDTDVAAAAQSSGNDILFTAADGVTKLNHEIESYTSSSGKLVAWVQIPTLSASADTLIYMYYGNSSASNQQNATGAWDSNYKAVYHLGNGTTLSTNDSTSNANNSSSATATATATGEIGGAASFNGSQKISLPNLGVSGAAARTVSMWIYPTSSSGRQELYSSGAASSYDLFNVIFNLTVSKDIYIAGFNGDVYTAANAITLNAWNHVTAVYDGSAPLKTTSGHIYVNGSSMSLTGTGPASSNLNTTNSNYAIAYDAPEGGNYFNGSIDEVRISNVARSAGWIGTEYNNESSPGTFFSEGSASYAAGTPTFSPVAGAYSTTQTVTISTGTSGATIRYTTDGSTPSETAGTVYSGALTVSSTTTIKAIAYKAAYNDSSVATATYTIQPIVATPTFSPVSDTYTSAQTVTISTRTSGATIRYTTDGSTPSETAGTIYSGALTVSAATTIKAIAYETGYTDSSVTTASYVISAWYNGLWSNRKAVTVDHTKVAGGSDLTNYPMLFSVTDPDVAAAAQSSGNDILFTAADGVTKLNHEIELYTSSSGKLIAWVQIPTLSASADTLIYVYYGNSSASNQQNATGVWDSNYKGVWHLPNGTTLTANDSTSNGLNAVSTSAGATSGDFGGGASFNGSNQYIMLPTTSIATNVTASAWVYSSNFNQNGFVVSKDNVNTQWQLFFEGAVKWRGGGSDNNTTCSLPSNSAWHYVVGTQSGTTTKLYIDGVACSTSTSSAIGNGSGDIEIGRYSSGYYFNGSIDEVRVSNVARSAGWIATEYSNESSLGTFYVVGAQH